MLMALQTITFVEYYTICRYLKKFSSLKFCPWESKRGSLTKKKCSLLRNIDEVGRFLRKFSRLSIKTSSSSTYKSEEKYEKIH